VVGFAASAGLVAVSGGGVGELDSQPIASAVVSRDRANDAHFLITRDPEIKFGISFAVGKLIPEITGSPGGHDQSGSSPKRDDDQY
jgi:hypothetical protein